MPITRDQFKSARTFVLTTLLALIVQPHSAQAQKSAQDWKSAMANGLSSSVTGDFARAEAAYRKALDISRTLNDGGVKECEAEGALLSVLVRQGKANQAEPILKSFLAHGEAMKKKGTLDSKTAIFVDEVADSYSVMSQQYEKQHQFMNPNYLLCLKRTVDIRESLINPNHPGLDRVRHALAQQYIRERKFKEAIACLEKRLAAARKIDYQEIDDLVFLGSCYEMLGVKSKADALFLRAKNLYERAKQPGRFDITRGDFHVSFLDVEKAEKYYLAGIKETPESPATYEYLVAAHAAFCEILCLRKNYKRAEKEIRTAVELSRKLYGADSDKNGGLLKRLSFILNTQGRHKEAQAVAKELDSLRHQSRILENDITRFFSPEIEAARKAGSFRSP